MNEKNRVEKIRCGGTGCIRIVAERRAGGTVVVRDRHHGETHVTIIEPLREKLSPSRPMGGKNKFEKIRCDETNCTDIVAERRADGAIVIRARHWGREHVTIIPPGPPKQKQDLAVAPVKPVMVPDTSTLP